MNIITADDANFDKILEDTQGRSIVYFGAPWCGPCSQLAPIMEEIASENPEITVVKVNVDEAPISSSKFYVRGVPSVFIVENGTPIANKVGNMRKPDVLRLYES